MYRQRCYINEPMPYSLDPSNEGASIMRIAVKKWGNSASVRIPAALMSAASLSLDDEIEMREEGGLIIIEPVRNKALDLETLLAHITPENLHGEVSTGGAVGQEAF